jgi:hypothetical protein
MMAIVKGIGDSSAEIRVKAFSCGKPDTTLPENALWRLSMN